MAVGDSGDMGTVVMWGGGVRCRGWWVVGRKRLLIVDDAI